tara:strand:- start:356 stop:577 length:222 start_codon:yes stop_codon:yes gene_type:complete
LFKISRKKLIVPIKKINGKISNKIENELKKVRRSGIAKVTLISLKKVISSRIFMIIAKLKKKKLTIRIFLRKV